MHDNIQQLLANLIRPGTIDSIDIAARRVRVRAGELLTAPLPWVAGRAGDVSSWCPPSVGEQVVLFSPNGEPAAGFVVASLFSTANSAPPGAAPGMAILLFADGARLAYDQTAHRLVGALPSGGAIDVTAPNGITLKGDIAIKGNLTVSGTIHADGAISSDDDVTAGSISLKNHQTTGVTAGRRPLRATAVKGMNRTTGKALEGDAHLAQSIGDILLTPYGSLIGLREYGSRLLDLLDAPANTATTVLLFAATATALMRWEPRISVERVAFAPVDALNGSFTLTVSGKVVDTGQSFSVAVPVPSTGVVDA